LGLQGFPKGKGGKWRLKRKKKMCTPLNGEGKAAFRRKGKGGPGETIKRSGMMFSQVNLKK